MYDKSNKRMRVLAEQCHLIGNTWPDLRAYKLALGQARVWGSFSHRIMANCSGGWKSHGMLHNRNLIFQGFRSFFHVDGDLHRHSLTFSSASTTINLDDRTQSLRTGIIQT